MKRKPNKPEQEPRERPSSWEEPADPGGASSGAAGGGSQGGAGTEGTSGQSVHKSKFRQKSKQEQAAASKLRMEKRGEKLEAAKGKLAKQKPPKKPGPIRRVGRAAGGAAGHPAHTPHRARLFWRLLFCQLVFGRIQLFPALFHAELRSGGLFLFAFLPEF